MKLIDRLREWWQLHTGEEETPFDGDTPAWLVSMAFHFVLLVVVTFMPVLFVKEDTSVQLAAIPEEEVEELEIPEEFYFNEQPAEEIGANSFSGVEMAQALAQVIDEVSDVPNPLDDVQPVEVATIQINNTIEIATGPQFDQNLRVKGFVGQGATGAVGAIDRITHEILLSLEERKTLVVWLFDQTESVVPQRQAIHDRFDRIYEELGLIEASGNEVFAKHEDKPLLTSVVGFGASTVVMTEKPTDDLEEIKRAVADIPLDPNGTEKVFEAVLRAVQEYKSYREVDERTGEPNRNVMIVVFTDEAGVDYETLLEPTIAACRRFAIPVYVVGVPAPFGRKETMMKWVDPDPEFDQTPQWGEVEQGPESLYPERLKLEFAAGVDRDEAIDSGFGPYALTRLCYETGGIYFAVHPNRNVSRSVGRGEIEAFTSHLTRFFDPQIMRKYRPDYVPREEYMRRVRENKAREALLIAANESWVSQMEAPQTRFAKTDEASFVNALSEAQKQAAKLEPQLHRLYEILKVGEVDRPKEDTLRWQAGFDLAMGRVLAAKARTEAYNAMLAAAKRGLKFKDEKNNTWILEPADEISVGSALEKAANKAREYLQRVVDEHPDTPWAYLAQKELENPIGWRWAEEYTPPPGSGNAGAGNNNPPPNDALRMLDRKPKRNVPKL
ncbi:MAG: VWA domain-containing protein [Planctomycetes bacterium]|nr:VWA domain-containing protein [Planctomycetota bacterium]